MEVIVTEFNESRWSDSGFAKEYRDNADIYIVERNRLTEIMKSFYRFFAGTDQGNKILDLGCGDGIITQQLHEIDTSISAVLIDASGYMLDKAKERLRGLENIHYVQASFQELLSKGIPGGMFDIAVSSQAIHHLTMEEKKRLFKKIYTSLQSGAYFLNIDVVIAQTDSLENWYMKLWQEWIDVKVVSSGKDDVSFQDIVRRYKEAEENKPDTLDDQLNALKDIGFKEVDCFYKYGIFAVYGGRKEKS
jgi:tRNA (cmo5U34)-methyltransferase